MSVDMLLGCIAIGIGAALAAMAWPFRRGFLGIAVNLAAGTGGAVGLTALSYGFLPRQGPVHFLFATVGATLVLLIAHGFWFWIAARAHRQAQLSQRPAPR
jgi:hypothetical protein